jgi:hypothetical protein
MTDEQPEVENAEAAGAEVAETEMTEDEKFKAENPLSVEKADIKHSGTALDRDGEPKKDKDGDRAIEVEELFAIQKPKVAQPEFLCKMNADGGAQLIGEDGNSFQVDRKELSAGYDLVKRKRVIKD